MKKIIINPESDNRFFKAVFRREYSTTGPVLSRTKYWIKRANYGGNKKRS